MTHVVPRSWAGETVVCLATGPSLTPEDVAFCQGRSRVIAVNDAHRLAPWADVLYSSDVGWWRYYGGVPEFVGEKYSIAQSHMRYFKQMPSILVLRNTGETGLETDPTGLRTLKNSGGAAINLAVHFGAARVLLLGYDMRPGHWFGEHPAAIRRGSPYGDFRTAIATTAKPLRALSVQVINCSRKTALSCFPCQDLESALSIAVAA